jgi:hypothetical protein
MAEKLTATDTAVSSKAQSRRVPSEVAILRSKRQASRALQLLSPEHHHMQRTIKLYLLILQQKRKAIFRMM